MQARLLIAAVLIAVFAFVSARPPGKEGDFHMNTLMVPADANGPAHETLAYEDAEQGSLSAQHQEALDADALLNALIKRLTQQIADDTSATNQKVSDRTASIKKFDDAVTSAKAYLDDLTNQLTALNKKIDEAKTALATRTGEKSAEQAAIDKENAEQRARLADRIAAVEKQIALIKQILQLLSNVPVDATIPDSIILDSTQERTVVGLFANTQWAGKKYVRCFLASASGYAASAYNQACNGKAGLFTIVKATNGNVFGGFTSVAQDGSGNYKVDANSFLYSLVKSGTTNLVKIPVSSTQYSTYTRSDYGPTFGGGHDLYISDKCNANTGSYNNPHSYSYPSGVSPISGGSSFQCADYEVFQLV